eukprot:gene5136-5220_t
MDDNITGVVGVGQDITSRKQAEQQRETVAKDVGRLIDHANAPIFGIATDGTVNEWNQKARLLTGYTREEVLGRDLVQNYISPDYQASVQDVLQAALQGTETANFEFPLFTKQGQRLEIILNASSRRDMDDNITGVVGVGQDITSRKQAEQERETVAKDVGRLIDHANAPIFGIATDGTVNEWNQAAVALTGFPRDEVLGRQLVSNYIAPPHQRPVRDVLDAALAGTETANFELPVVTKSGANGYRLLFPPDPLCPLRPLLRVNRNPCHRPGLQLACNTAPAPLPPTPSPTPRTAPSLERVILLNASARLDGHGHIIGVVGVGQDITLRKAAELSMMREAATARDELHGNQDLLQ